MTSQLPLQYPQQYAPGGTIVVHTAVKGFNSALQRFELFMNGYPVFATWGQTSVTAPAGPHHIQCQAQYLFKYGRASIDVVLAPGQVLDVYYAPPAFTFLSGSIGLQPVKGKGFVAMWIFVGFAVAVVLGLFAALVWSATH